MRADAVSRLDITGEYFGRDLEAMSFAVRYHQWIFDEFAPFLGPNVAEIGAGTGNFSQELLTTEIERLSLSSLRPTVPAAGRAPEGRVAGRADQRLLARPDR